MSLRFLRMVVGICIATTGIAGCKRATGVPYLDFTAGPSVIDATGLTASGTTQLQITTFSDDSKGTPGTGTVQVTAPLGVLRTDTQQDKAVGLTLQADGTAQLNYTCDVSQDANCATIGRAKLTAVWNGVTRLLVVTVTPKASDGGPDSGFDAGPDAGPIVGANGVTLTLRDSKPQVFYNVGDYSDVTATLELSDGGGYPNQPVSFSTSGIGALGDPDGGTFASTFTANTNAKGLAVARFKENGVTGPAAVTATHLPSGASSSIQIPIVNVQQVSWQSTTCGGTPNCKLMGIKGSGYNEQAQITFQVVDASGKAAPNIKVTFSVGSPPSGVTVTPSGTTDAQGMVTANVSSGGVIGVFSVHAVAIVGQVQTDSPSIGIRGAKVTNGGFSFYCSPINIGAYVSPVPPLNLSVPCNVGLADRYGNRVGTGTSVFFLSEAGSIPNSVATKAFDPSSADQSAEGTGVVQFATRPGPGFPVDVDPLPALSQPQGSRSSEPSFQPTGTMNINNPRDSLVSVIAYTRGEEFFDDSNNNGVRDPGERFYDQGEAFVDSNDNGVWDQGEVYIDDSPANGVWDGPNGVWDSDKTVWAETRILYSGRPSDRSSLVFNPFSGTCATGPLQKGQQTRILGYFLDSYYNRPQASGTSFTAAHAAAKGTVSVESPGLLDGYGFDLQRILVDPTDGTNCKPASPVCQWKVIFGRWALPVTSILVQGADSTDTTACTGDQVNVTSTVLEGNTTLSATGAIQ